MIDKTININHKSIGYYGKINDCDKASDPSKKNQYTIVSQSTTIQKSAENKQFIA